MTDPGTPMVWYGSDSDPDGDGAFFFDRVCPVCGRFAKADSESSAGDIPIPNATCKIHGRVRMPFGGYL